MRENAVAGFPCRGRNILNRRHGRPGGCCRLRRCAGIGAAGGRRAARAWTNGNAAGATCDGGPVCASGWRSAAVALSRGCGGGAPDCRWNRRPLRPTGPAGAAATLGTAATLGQLRRRGAAATLGYGGVGVAGAGRRTVGWFRGGCACAPLADPLLAVGGRRLHCRARHRLRRSLHRTAARQAPRVTAAGGRCRPGITAGVAAGV